MQRKLYTCGRERPLVAIHRQNGFANPVPSRVLPSLMFNKHGSYTAFVKIAERFKDAEGIVINTFEELETYALSCFVNGQNPPIYPVGAVIHPDSLPHPELEQLQRDRIMKWLDNQPESSVVFLCFGSHGCHGPPQVKEIALGLEQSGQRFLWSLRMPETPLNDAAGAVHYKNPEEMLPEGTVRGRRWRLELIFVPSSGVGRLASTVEFAKRLNNHDHRIWVTVLCIQWFSSGFVDAYIEEPARIHFIQLPHKCYHKYCVYEIYFQLNLDVATDLGLPSYTFLTSNAATLGLILYLPIRHRQNSLEFECPKPDTQNTDLEHLILGFANPVPSCVLPSFLFNKDGGYTAFVKFAQRFKDAKGIVINTIEELEPYALRCFSNAQNPPIYPVGPVIQLDGLPNPDMGSHEPPQVKEIALALDRSGHKFLWSLHVPPAVDAAAGTVHFKNPEEMLPEGSWKGSKRGGWYAGGHHSVPIVTWPMFAEQQLNAYMMKELGLAVVMTLDYRKGISDVMADEI
ncbi:hypothetical protein GOBAR_AA23712 [Gossypium barbadense]|uniref:Uncharacterized protein n=1 Tax=Gossypium barbadense TaxID=3634 RepID=A0A2P5X0X2_GOSBA|nr:hypothetical protein GOBAR_AA23712 [Gossypium barbadense]